jgi:hypothetical protein
MGVNDVKKLPEYATLSVDSRINSVMTSENSEEKLPTKQ